MKPICKKPKHGQLNPADRLSALPDNVIYRIISFLGFKEACRTSILSKRWTYISDTNPVMELSNDVFSAVPDLGNWYNSIVKVDSFLKYTETRMKRYSKYKLHINKLKLGFPIRKMTFPNSKVLLENKVEKWVKIAVRNQVAGLVLNGPKNYVLSDILFTAKSLRRLDCSNLEIYDYEGIDIFPSLECLFLHEVFVDDSILNRIISSSLLLKHLRLSGCYGFYKSIKSIVIPANSKLETLDLSKSLSIDEGKVTIDSSSLTSFQYIGDSRNCAVIGDRVERWPVFSKDSSLRNLRILKIGLVSITDEVLDKLLSDLVLLETLKLCNCSVLRTIRISSVLIKDVRLENCSDLLEVSIDAPCLETFEYKGDFEPSMCINALAVCHISLHIPSTSFCTDRVSKLKKLLIGLGNCHVFKIVLLDDPAEPNKNECDDIDFDDEKLANAHLGPPCDIRELKLTLSSETLSKSRLSAFSNGVFWTCHPRTFSLRVNSEAPKVIIEPLIRKLKEMANCLKHPLKRVEVEGSNWSLEARKKVLDVQLRLHW
ncbi:hypothetical protein KSS87_002376 [Heliosperma pusillum]|nr:hypothetical protein KSS87_002376 [Heliosperma pusillum]